MIRRPIRYVNGVNSMLALQTEIKALQDHLEGLQPQIEETTKKTQELCDEIEKRQTEADSALQVRNFLSAVWENASDIH